MNARYELSRLGYNECIRLEYRQGTSQKFYELVAPGIHGMDQWTIRYGRIGANPTMQSVDRATAEKRLEQKVAKGYAVVSRPAVPTPIPNAGSGKSHQVTATSSYRKRPGGSHSTQVAVASPLDERIRQALPSFKATDRDGLIALAADHGLTLNSTFKVPDSVVPGAARVLVYVDKAKRLWALVSDATSMRVGRLP